MYTGLTLVIYIGTTIHNGISNKISRRANELSRQSFVAVQRAFITIADLQKEQVTDGAGKISWRFTPIIENSGNTPTTALRFVYVTPRSAAWARSIIQNINRERRIERPVLDLFNEALVERQIGSPSNPDEIFSWPNIFLNEVFTTPNAVLGPKGILRPFFASEAIDQQDARDIVADKLGRFFAGSVRYKDIFDNVHITKYCFRVDTFILNVSELHPVGGTFCQHWNCVDEQCAEDKQGYQEDLMRFPASLQNPIILPTPDKLHDR